MEYSKNSSWSCYPQGLEPSRRAFMRALAIVGAGLSAGPSVPATLLAEQGGEDDDDSVPAFPEGGFPAGSTRLNFNENPLGPSPKALKAILRDGLEEGNRYNYINPLLESIARHHEVPAENVVVGCGSTEFLQFTPWAFLKTGASLVIPDPSYGFMTGVARGIGAIVLRVPLGAEGTIDTVAMKKTIRPDTRLVYIANPNNPTGASLPLSEVKALAEALPGDAILFVDEAYHDFLPDQSALELVRAEMPVIVSRTFSKAYGMAGLRLGYAIAPKPVMEKLKEVWWGDFGINAAARIAGPVALQDQDHVKHYVKLIDEGLRQLRGGLAKMGYHSYSHRAPFFMVDLGRRAHATQVALYKQKIYVQDGNNWKMPSFLRVSVGLPQENEVFLRAMRDLPS